MIKNTKFHLNSHYDNYTGKDLREAGKTGLFFTYNITTKNISSVHYCREVFLSAFSSRTRYVGFASRKLDVRLLEEFFDKIDQKIKLKNSIVIHTTEHKGIYILEVNDFWRVNSTMRSLFTLFLRASVYYQGDFWAAFKSYVLAKNIYPVIEHFFAGNINPTFETANIVDYFRPYPIDSYAWSPRRRKLIDNYKEKFTTV